MVANPFGQVLHFGTYILPSQCCLGDSEYAGSLPYLTMKQILSVESKENIFVFLDFFKQ